MDNRELYITAELAKLRVAPEDVDSLGAEITQILEYFEKMKEIDVNHLEPTTHALLKQNRVREDSMRTENYSEAILENAPETEENFITIPRIL